MSPNCACSELPDCAEGRVLHQRVVSPLGRPRSRRSDAAGARSESGRHRRQDPAAHRRQQTQRFPAAQVLQTPGLQTGAADRHKHTPNLRKHTHYQPVQFITHTVLSVTHTSNTEENKSFRRLAFRQVQQIDTNTLRI